MTDVEKLTAASNYLNNGDYHQAYELLQPLLKEGNPSAQYLMGFMVHKGYGVTKDLKKAEELYLSSARQGVAVAYRHLGSLYYKDTHQLEKAYKCFVEGARLHDKSCIHNGRFMFENHEGVVATEEEEARWQLYEAYYDNDLPRMKIDIYYAAWKFSPEFGEEIVDLYYYKAKHENDLNAMFTLACAYKNGKGTAQKTSKAIYWFKKLVEKDPKHGRAWMSLYELNEISEKQLMEKLKEINNPILFKEAEENFHLVIEKTSRLSIEEEINLIRTLYKEMHASVAYLQVREFCRNHQNISDLRKLKIALSTVFQETDHDLRMKVVVDIYGVADALYTLGDESAKGEMRYLKRMYSVKDTDVWHETQETEGLYLYEDKGEYLFLNEETFENISLSYEEVKPYLNYLQEGDHVKLHYLRFGSFLGMTL